MKCRLTLLLLALLALPAQAATNELEAIAREIESTITSVQNEPSYESWRHQGLTPETLSARLAPFASTPHFSRAICQRLEPLAYNELSLFQEFLEVSPLSQLVHCREHLLERMDAYLQSAEARLLSQWNHLGPETAGPSVERFIDASGGYNTYTGDLPQKMFALTFDDGPHPRHTEQLLTVLEAEDVQVTFFMVGRNVKSYPTLVRRVAQAGHTVGTHTWSHKDLRKQTFASAQQEIADAFWAVYDILGFADPFFRYPYGNDTQSLNYVLAHESIANFFWNVDSEDWKIRDPELLYQSTLARMDRTGRGIVLFHDIQAHTVAMMPAFLKAIKAQGIKLAVFRPATIDQPGITLRP